MNKLIERLLDTGRLSPVQMQELFDDIEEALEAADKMAEALEADKLNRVMNGISPSVKSIDRERLALAYRNLTQEARDD